MRLPAYFQSARSALLPFFTLKQHCWCLPFHFAPAKLRPTLEVSHGWVKGYIRNDISQLCAKYHGSRSGGLAGATAPGALEYRGGNHMNTGNSSAIRGVAVYSVASLVLVSLVAAAMVVAGLDIGSGAGFAAITTGMWTPALARWIARRTVDSDWKAPLPMRRWGRPRLWVILGPVLIVAAIYLVAYLAALAMGVDTGEPTWKGPGKIAINVLFNVVTIPLVFVVGSIGEEIGWRGYMQPRLDQAGVRASLAIVIAVETIFHIPIIVAVAYGHSSDLAVTIGLFLLLKCGATPIWTTLTYATGSIWTAIWFHTYHNGLSQFVFPRAFGGDAGHEVLGEFGLFPVAAYILAAFALFLVLRLKKLTRRQLADKALKG